MKKCQAKQGSLLLLVDDNDEDRGISQGREFQSLAPHPRRPSFQVILIPVSDHFSTKNWASEEDLSGGQVAKGPGGP